ncbi:unnamed protein product [Gadus morhua 'NCC']
MAELEDSSKDETPVRNFKNHYTPVHSHAPNHGHYGKEALRGAPDMHNFISSGFVTLGRGHLKAQHSVDDLGHMSWQGDPDAPISYGNHQHDYQHSHLDLTLTPKMAHRQMRHDRPQRGNNILTSATEPYDLSRSFQNLSPLPPSFELPPLKAALTDKDVEDYYMRKHHDPGPRGPTHMVKLSDEPPPRQRPRRVQRAMSQDHVLSPPRTPRRSAGGGGGGGGGDYGLSAYGGMAAAYGSSRHLSEDQLLSAERLHSQEPLLLLSPTMRRDKFREKAMARAMSHADMLMPTTPKVDRHAKMIKMHSHPTPRDYNTLTVGHDYNTLTVGHGGGGGGGGGGPPSSSKRQAFASRRMHTVDHLQYVPAPHNYRTASKNEVTV